MSNKRGQDYISDVVGELLEAGAKRRARILSPSEAAARAARNATLRSARAIARAQMISAGLPRAESMWANDSRPRWAKYRDMSIAGPYARSIGTYNPRNNDWPGVDDGGILGGPATPYKLRVRKPYVMTPARQAAAARLRAASAARTAQRIASYTPEEYEKYIKNKAKRDAKKMGLL